MNHELVIAYWGGFILCAQVDQDYQVSIEKDAVHITWNGSEKCTFDEIDPDVYEIQHYQMEFDEKVTYHFLPLSDTYISDKNQYQIAAEYGRLSIFWVR